MPADPDAGVPARVAVPSPLSVKVTPVGSAPDSVSFATGLPVLVTVNDPAVPTVNVAELPLVMAGAVGAALTVSVKLWLASGLTPLDALIVIGKLPVDPDAGVPARVAVPSPLSVNVTPDGSDPDSVTFATGLPVVVTVNVPAVPAVNVADVPLVMAGACCTVMVSVCCTEP